MKTLALKKTDLNATLKQECGKWVVGGDFYIKREAYGDGYILYVAGHQVCRLATKVEFKIALKLIGYGDLIRD